MKVYIVSSRKDGGKKKYFSANELSPWTEYPYRAQYFQTTDKAIAVSKTLTAPKGSPRIDIEVA